MAASRLPQRYFSKSYKFVLWASPCILQVAFRFSVITTTTISSGKKLRYVLYLKCSTPGAKVRWSWELMQ